MIPRIISTLHSRSTGEGVLGLAFLVALFVGLGVL